MNFIVSQSCHRVKIHEYLYWFSLKTLKIPKTAPKSLKKNKTLFSDSQIHNIEITHKVERERESQNLNIAFSVLSLKDLISTLKLAIILAFCTLSQIVQKGADLHRAALGCTKVLTNTCKFVKFIKRSFPIQLSLNVKMDGRAKLF